tara:strand:+ start:208 stop:1401 length:1194 start_codon:yes stop_codon:yes gene_type:complete
MIKNLIKIILGFFIITLVIILKPIFDIRIGKYPIRLGPFVVTPEIWIRKKKILNIKSIDFWAHIPSQDPNIFLSKIVNRNVRFIPIYIYSSLVFFLNYFNFKKLSKFFFLKTYTRDTHNIIDNFSPIIKLQRNEIDTAENILLKNNVNTSKKIVCINVRDSLYLKKTFSEFDGSYHDRRDADINNYLSIIKYLVSKDYIVVRMGKYMKNKAAYEHPNFIDYPFCKFKTDLLDIYLGYKCYMSISTGSGWDSIPYSFRKPILYTNFSSHSKIQLSSIKHMTIFKLVKDLDNKYLKIDELLQNDLRLITNIYKEKKSVFSNYNYIENTNEDLLIATKEFEKYVENNFVPSEEQKEYKSKFLSKFNSKLVTDVYGEPAHSKDLRGMLCSSFLKKYEEILF